MPPNTHRDNPNKEGMQSPPPDLEITQPTLPAEVIDLIVDELSENENQDASLDSLLSLALASRRLCMRAYRHIFSEIHLTLAHDFGRKAGTSPPDALTRVLEQLHDILIHGLEFPDLAMVYHLRSVWITVKFNRRDELPLFFSLPKFPEVLQLLHGSTHGITCFKFEVESSNRRDAVSVPADVSSAKMNPKFSDAFRALCRSPHLKTLHLKHVVLRPTTLRGIHIESIHLQEVTFEDYPEAFPLERLQHLDLEAGFVVQPTAMTLICTIRGRNVSYLPTDNPIDVTTRFGVGITDLVEIFHPSHHIDTSLARQEVFARMTSLTLMDLDCSGIQLDLVPNLQSLKVIQCLFPPPASNFGYSTLHSFFELNPGVVRNLGSTKSLTVKTDIEYSRMFLYDNGRDSNAIPFMYVKPTRASWRDVDQQSTSALGKVENIKFMFRFVLRPDEELPSLYDEPSFVAENRKIIAGYFPRLSALPSFSLNVIIERQQKSTITTGVEFKDLGNGQWLRTT